MKYLKLSISGFMLFTLVNGQMDSTSKSSERVLHKQNNISDLATVSFPLDSIEILRVNRTEYKDKLKGFWLGSCIANWTGLPTENRRTDFPFFTDLDFGPGKFDYILDQNPWGADDDTDIEYIYQSAIEKHNNYMLTGEQISHAWQDHIGLPLLWVF